MTIREGGCLCGAVRYRMRGEPIFVNCCHCRDCQRLSGSAFAINAMIEADLVELAMGESLADGVDRDSARCPQCGVLLWGTIPMFGAAIRFVRAGTLDRGETVIPSAHFFVRSKHPWIAIPEGVPAFDTLPGDDDPSLFGPEAAARIAAAEKRRGGGSLP